MLQGVWEDVRNAPAEDGTAPQGSRVAFIPPTRHQLTSYNVQTKDDTAVQKQVAELCHKHATQISQLDSMWIQRFRILERENSELKESNKELNKQVLKDNEETHQLKKKTKEQAIAFEKHIFKKNGKVRKY